MSTSDTSLLISISTQDACNMEESAQCGEPISDTSTALQEVENIYIPMILNAIVATPPRSVVVVQHKLNPEHETILKANGYYIYGTMHNRRRKTVICWRSKPTTIKRKKYHV